MARTTRARLGVGSSKAGGAAGGGDDAQRKRALELAKRSVEDETVVGRPDAPWSVLVYGESGVGKTTFLAQIPGVIFLPVERGANQVRVAQWRDPIVSMDQLEDVLDVLRFGKHDHKAVVLETLDAVEALVRERIENRLNEAAAGAPKSKDGKPAPRTIAEWNEAEYGAGYDALVDEWRSLFARLDALRDERGMCVGLSAHAKVQTVPTLDVKEDFKRYTLQVTGSKCIDAIKGWAEYVLFFRTEVHVSKEGRKTLAAHGNRYMYMTQQATHDAKCRGTLVFPDKLPLDPTGGWETFEKCARTITAFSATYKGRLAEALSALPDERAAALTKVFDGFFSARDYAACGELLDQAETEIRQKKNGTASTAPADVNESTKHQGSET